MSAEAGRAGSALAFPIQLWAVSRQAASVFETLGDDLPDRDPGVRRRALLGDQQFEAVSIDAQARRDLAETPSLSSHVVRGTQDAAWAGAADGGSRRISIRHGASVSRGEHEICPRDDTRGLSAVAEGSTRHAQGEAEMDHAGKNAVAHPVDMTRSIGLARPFGRLPGRTFRSTIPGSDPTRSLSIARMRGLPIEDGLHEASYLFWPVNVD